MKFSTSRIKEQKNENVIVAIAIVGIVIFILSVFGWSSIAKFLSTPLFWKGQDSLETKYISTMKNPKTTGGYTVYLELVNNTHKEINDYDISFVIEGEEIEYASYYNDDISAFGLTTLKLDVIDSGVTSFSYGPRVSTDTIEKLLNSKAEDVDVTCKIKTLVSDGEKLVSNTGLFKDILIVVLSLICGIIGFFGTVGRQWLRIVLKLLSIPAVLVILVIVAILAFAVYSNTAEGQAAMEESRRKAEQEKKAKAASEYKSASHTRAAAAARGDYKTAAYAQEKMDKSMADMMAGRDANTSKYKSAAHVKAAATVRGDKKTAAYAQADMDRQMADILGKK